MGIIYKKAYSNDIKKYILMVKRFLLLLLSFLCLIQIAKSEDNLRYQLNIDSVNYISSDSVVVLNITLVNNTSDAVTIDNPEYYLISKDLFWIPLRWDIIISYNGHLCVTEGRFIFVSKGDTKNMMKIIEEQSSYSFNIPIKLDDIYCEEEFELINYPLFSVQLKIESFKPKDEIILSNIIEVQF